jgi:hypothetical protein
MFSFAISYKFTDHAGVFKLNSNTLLEYVHLSVLRQSYLIPGGDNGLFSAHCTFFTPDGETCICIPCTQLYASVQNLVVCL